MRPIRTRATTGIYGAPENSVGVGGLPYHRTFDETITPGAKVPVIHSTWDFTPEERAAIASGAMVQLGHVGEPMHPVSLTVVLDVEEIA